MRRILISLLFLLPALLPAAAAHAGGTTPPDRAPADPLGRAEALAREGLDTLLRSLEALRGAVPQYGLPYLDPQGNIVIPRQAPPETRGTPVPEEPPLRT